jgi:ribosome maturation factor RimP
MTKIEHLHTILKEPLATKGYEILQLRYLTKGRSTLEILLERLDEQAVTIDDCAKASRLISATLDVEDPIAESYVIEVSSPGLDRPLIRLRDYERFKGALVKGELHHPLKGTRRFKGHIQSVEEGHIVFCVEGASTGEKELLRLGFEEICHCKLLPLL